jgi:hypothetical protein
MSYTDFLLVKKCSSPNLNGNENKALRPHHPENFILVNNANENHKNKSKDALRCWKGNVFL